MLKKICTICLAGAIAVSGMAFTGSSSNSASAAESTISVNQVSDLTKEYKGQNNIKLTWDKISNANGYEVYYKRNISDDWTLYRTTANNYISISNVCTYGLKYNFRVRAYKNTNEDGLVYGKYAYISATAGTPAKVTNLKAKVLKKQNKIKLTWSHSGGASFYYVYRKKGSDGWNYIATVSGKKSYTDDLSWEYAKKCRYKVTAVTRTAHYGVLEGAASNKVKKRSVSVEKPYNVSVKQVSKESKKVKISWGGVHQGGYIIYRKTKNGHWKKVKTIAKTGKTSVTLNVPKTNKKYYFKIVNYVKANGHTYKSKASKVKSVKMRRVLSNTNIYKRYYGTFKCGSYSGKMYVSNNSNYWQTVVDESDSVLTCAPGDYGVPALTLLDHSNQVFRALWYVSVGDTCTITTNLGTTKLKCVKVNYRQWSWWSKYKSLGVTSSTVAMQTCEVGGGSTYGNRIVVWKVVSGPSISKLKKKATKLTKNFYYY